MNPRKRRKCERHEGIKVSYEVSEKVQKCPVCLRDEVIEALSLEYRYLDGYFYWGLDWIRIASYRGIDRQEREQLIEKVHTDFVKYVKEKDLKSAVRVLEEYGEIRKNYTWRELRTNS